MLINAQTREELRVAIVDGNRLEEFQVEVAERGSTRGNIYRGLIARIEPSLNAAFIDYGAERHGFLPIQDVVPEAWYKRPGDGDKKPRIEEVLERNRPIIVQVAKEPEGQKGAALTTNLSFAGRYLVLTPFDDTRGVSRKVEDEETRRRLKEQVKKLEVPEGCGVIVRTAALDQNKAVLSRDLAALLRLWKRVSSEARGGKSVQLIYSDQDLILQALRDYLDPSVEEILVDDDEALARAEEYLKAFLPRGGNRLVRYTDREPLFSRYGLEPQIDDIHQRRVFLPSGGSIVIDRTEALTAIDVNSGRSTKAATQEQTALDTNLEAADEVARQLRLRDIGGLVVVDFIDMRSVRSQKRVEKALRDAMKADKARSSVGRISENGLLEINRQRIHQTLSLRTHRTCPSCDGTGRVPSPEMVGLNLLRRIEARAATAPLERVRIALSPELCEAFQNGRRRELAALEREFGMRIEIVPSPRLNLREQEVEWVKREATPADGRPAVVPIVPATARVARIGEAEEAGEPAPRAVAAGEAAPQPEKPAIAEADAGGRRKRRRRRRRKRGGGAGAEDGRGEEAQGAGATEARGPAAAPAAEREEAPPRTAERRERPGRGRATPVGEAAVGGERQRARTQGDDAGPGRERRRRRRRAGEPGRRGERDHSLRSAFAAAAEGGRGGASYSPTEIPTPEERARLDRLAEEILREQLGDAADVPRPAAGERLRSPRGRRGRFALDQTEGGGAVEPAAPAHQAAEPAAPAPETGGAEPAAAKPRRPRKRPAAAGKAADAEAPSAPAPVGEAAEAAEAAGEPSAAKPRRRSSGGRRKAPSEAPDGPAPAPEEES
jgi:ribonuclease E